MDFWLQIPLELRMSLLFACGLVVGGQVNRGIYRLAWFPRNIGAWSPPPAGAAPRRWTDRLPIIGWWGLRREAALHGRGFWIRPLLMELTLGAFFTWLYWWEVDGRLVPSWAPAMSPASIHLQYLSHIILVSLMAVATFIDFDEKTIPDAITVPGLLLGLVLAALAPASHLPFVDLPNPLGPPVIEHLRVTSPQPWPAALNSPRWLGAAMGLYLAWCLAVTPAVWTTRCGMGKAFQFWLASMVRHRTYVRLVVLVVSGMLIIGSAWVTSGDRWAAVFSSLVGMAFGGGLVWAVRVVAGAALGKEAMGFGDVTLMAMIGAYVGWQPSLYIFFLAPFLGIAIAIAQWVLTRRPDIAYGPYLCAATLCAIILWGQIWTGWLEDIFRLGWIIPAALVVCMALMGLMLMGLQLVKSAAFRDQERV